MDGIRIVPMGILDCRGVNKLRKVLHDLVPGKERSSLYSLVLHICFVLSCFSLMRKLIYRVCPHFSFETLVAKNDDGVVGIAWLQGTGNSGVMLAGIVIATGYQGKGLGSRLDKSREDLARSHGVKRLELSIAGDNSKSRYIHEKLGYKVIRLYLGRDL